MKCSQILLTSLGLIALLAGGPVACSSSKSVREDGGLSEEVARSAERAEAQTVQEESEQKPEVDGVQELPFYAVGPIARVGGDDIGAKIFNKMVEAYKEQWPELLPAQALEILQMQMVQAVINAHLVDQVLQEMRALYTDGELDELIEEFRERFPHNAAFDEYLSKRGMTFDELRESFFEVTQLEMYLVQRYGLTLTEEEMERFFEENRARYDQPEQVHARHIFIKVAPDADPATVQEAEQRAQALYREALTEGADFEALARAKSEGSSAAEGGDLGFISRLDMLPPFSEVAFNLKPGEISKPVRTLAGYHIISLVELREGSRASFDEVKDEVHQNLRGVQLIEAYQKFFDEMREQMAIEIFEENLEINADKVTGDDVTVVPIIRVQ